MPFFRSKAALFSALAFLWLGLPVRALAAETPDPPYEQYETFENNRRQGKIEAAASLLEKVFIEDHNSLLSLRESDRTDLVFPPRFWIDQDAWLEAIERVQKRNPALEEMIQRGKELRDAFFDQIDSRSLAILKQYKIPLRVNEEIQESIDSFLRMASEEKAKMDRLLVSALAREQAGIKIRGSGDVAKFNRRRFGFRTEEKLSDEPDVRKKQAAAGETAFQNEFRFWKKAEIARLKKLLEETMLRELVWDQRRNVYRSPVSTEELENTQVRVTLPKSWKGRFDLLSTARLLLPSGEYPIYPTHRYSDYIGQIAALNGNAYSEREPGAFADARIVDLLATIQRRLAHTIQRLDEIDANLNYPALKLEIDQYRKDLSYATPIAAPYLERNYVWRQSNQVIVKPNPLFYALWFLKSKGALPTGPTLDLIPTYYAFEEEAYKRYGIDEKNSPPRDWRKERERRKSEKLLQVVASENPNASTSLVHSSMLAKNSKRIGPSLFKGALVTAAAAGLAWVGMKALPAPLRDDSSTSLTLLSDPHSRAQNQLESTSKDEPHPAEVVFSILPHTRQQLPQDFILPTGTSARTPVEFAGEKTWSEWGIRVVAKQPLGSAGIPTGRAGRLIDVQVFGPGGRLNRGIDYDVKATENGAYVLENRGAGATTPVTIHAEFTQGMDSSRPEVGALPAFLRDISRDRLASLSTQLKQDGFHELSANLETALESGSAVSIYDLERIYSESSDYHNGDGKAETQGLAMQVQRFFGASPFLSLKTFLNDNGRAQFNCQGFDAIFKASLNWLLKGEPSVKVESEALFVRDGESLQIDSERGHKRTVIVYQEGGNTRRLRLDSTGVSAGMGEKAGFAFRMAPAYPSAHARAEKPHAAPEEPARISPAMAASIDHPSVETPETVETSPRKRIRESALLNRRKGVLADLTGDDKWDGEEGKVPPGQKTVSERLEIEKGRWERAQQARKTRAEAKAKQLAEEKARMTTAALRGEIPIVDETKLEPLSETQKRARFNALVEALGSAVDLTTDPLIAKRMPRTSAGTPAAEMSHLVQSLARYLLGEISETEVVPLGTSVTQTPVLVDRLATFRDRLRQFHAALQTEIGTHSEWSKTNPSARLPRWAEQSKVLDYGPVKAALLAVADSAVHSWSPFEDKAKAQSDCAGAFKALHLYRAEGQ